MNADLPPGIRRWGMWCHLSTVVPIVLGGFLLLPFVGVIMALIIWLIGRSRHPFVNDQGKESLNFQLSMALYWLIAIILFVFLSMSLCGLSTSSTGYNDALTTVLAILFWGGLLLMLAMGIFQVIAAIVASVKAYRGELYRYPFTLRFVR